MKTHLPRIFLVLAVVGLASALSAATAPAPIRLYEITVTKFVMVDGQSRVQEGQLRANHAFRVAHDNPTATQVPVSLQGKPLIYTEAWFAFDSLGPEAIANFELIGGPHTIAGLVFYEVGVREEAVLSVGTLANLSSRGLVTADERMIGGLVITEEHRWVLIRALGPSLVQAGVPNAIADPYLTLYQGNLPIYFNGDWGTRHNAAEIVEVTARVGAPPLPANSKDAVLLVELPPGIYTAHVQPETGEGGVTLLEIFSVPN